MVGEGLRTQLVDVGTGVAPERQHESSQVEAFGQDADEFGAIGRLRGSLSSVMAAHSDS